MTCANCGVLNPLGSIFCGSCGSALEQASSAPDSSTPVPPASSSGELESPALADEDAPTLRIAPSSAVASEGASAASIQPARDALQPLRVFPAEPPNPDSPDEIYPTPPPVQPTPILALTDEASSSFATLDAGSTQEPSSAQPAPGFAGGQISGAYPTPPSVSGTLPVQPAPGFAGGQISGAYPSSAASGALPSGTLPAQPAPGFAGERVSGAYPSVPASYSGQLSQPNWPSYPGQFSQPGWGGYPAPGAVPPPVTRGPSKLINPLPLWAFIPSIALVVVVLLLLFFFTGSDWAAGAQYASWVAFGLGGAILIAFLIRTGLGMLAQTNAHRRSQILSSLLLALLLFVVGTLGLTQQASVHAMQARFAEGRQQWQTAITEYQDAGERPPSSTTLAHLYNEWGEQLLAQQDYKDAIKNFDMVIQQFSQASDQVTQAQKDEISAYQAWANQAVQKQDYQNAVTRYDLLLGQPFCLSDSNCKSTTAAADATAYYDLAEQQLSAQDYSDAVKTFQALTTNVNFQSAPEIQKAHPDYAKALWGKAQQEIHQTCSDALSIYQQLIASFSDTPEGREAATGLKASIEVKGKFTTAVPAASTTPVVILSTTLITSSTTADQFATIYSNSPHTSINSDGTFDFAAVAPRDYQLIWGTLTDSDGLTRISGQTSNTTIGPLCTYDFGDLPYTIPGS